MWPFSRKPSAAEQLIALMREQIAQHQQVTSQMVGAMTAQTALVTDYLKSFATAGAPEVRVMTDLDEARLEKARDSFGDTLPHLAAYVPQNTASWLHEMESDLAALRKEV